MKENYDACLAIILKEEGGNDDDPRDPGGRTSRGIIQREWNVYRQSHPNRPPDVWQASSEDIAAIYHDNYWEPYCDNMPAGVDLVFFNTAVNSGRQQAVKELQRALGVSADGMMGMITFNALDAYHDYPGLIRNMCDQRRRFYKALRTFSVFGKGWLARTDRVEKSALELAAKFPGKVVASEHPDVDTKPSQPDVTVSPKGLPTDKSMKSSTEGWAAIIATITSIATALGQAVDSIKPLLQNTNTMIIIAAVGVAAGVYIWFRRRYRMQTDGT